MPGCNQSACSFPKYKKANGFYSESNSFICYHTDRKQSSMFQTSKRISETFTLSERVAQLILWFDQVPNFRQEICQQHDRNDPVKYDLAKITKSLWIRLISERAQTMTCQFGADIYCLLVTCKNVSWPALKFYYCWRTNEGVPITKIGWFFH